LTYRRLHEFSLDSLRTRLRDLKETAMEGVEENAGGFRAGHSSSGGINTEQGLLNLEPKQVSNFGWNWDFNMNATEEPEFNITGPGAKGIFKVRKPCIKVHAGIYLNFSSEFSGLVTDGLRGVARVRNAISERKRQARDAELTELREELMQVQGQQLSAEEKLADHPYMRVFQHQTGAEPNGPWPSPSRNSSLLSSQYLKS